MASLDESPVESEPGEHKSGEEGEDKSWMEEDSSNPKRFTLRDDYYDNYFEFMD